MTFNLLSALSLLMATGYLIAIQIAFGHQLSSISDSWYEFKKKDYSSAFNFFTAGVGIPMWFQYAYMESTGAILCFIFAGAALFWVGVASTFRDKSVDRIHYACAVGSIALGFIALFFEYGKWAYWPLGVFVVLVGIIRLTKINNSTTWIEVAAMVTILGSTFFL